MNFAVLECSRTWELCTEGRRAGFTTWIPVEHRYRTPAPTLKTPNPKPVVQASCALPGYMFVSFEEWPEFYQWAFDRYSPSVMMEFHGRANLPSVRRLSRPLQIPLSQLQEMDELLKKLWREEQERRSGGTSTPEAAVPMTVGQRIIVVYGPFKDMEGHVVKIKKNECRVQLGSKYITMPPAFLRLV